MFTKNASESAPLVRSSYAVANITAKKGKPYSDVEFIKKSLKCVIEIIYPKRKDFSWKYMFVSTKDI